MTSLPCRSRSSRLLLSSLLISYVFGAIVYSSAETTASRPSEPEITTTTSSLVSNEQSSSLIICTVDGSVFTIDAQSGMAKGYFGTGRPLVASSSPAVVPGLDGSIYTLSKDPQQVSKLPVTVQHIVQHPVQTCTGENECGVVTGTKHTFLYGLDPTTGRLEWTQQYGKTDPNDPRISTPPVVILHRQDFVVRHISTSTGEELWNVTLGHISALDFSTMKDDDPSAEGEPLLPGRRVVNELLDGEPKREEATTVSLPSVAFGSDGTTVAAIDQQNQVLWRRQLNTVIASVYGAVGNDWVPLTVIDTSKERLKGSDTAMVPLVPPLSRDFLSEQRDIHLKLLWNEVQRVGTANAHESDMVIWTPPQMDLGSSDFNRLAQKSTTTRFPPVCKGQTIDGICYDTPLLDSGTHQKEQAAGIYLTWDRLLVVGLFLLLGSRVLVAHKRRVWIAERQKAPPPHRDLPDSISPEGRHIQPDRELALSEQPFVSQRVADSRMGRSPSVPDTALYNMETQPGADLWNLEKVDVHSVNSAPNATDTSASSSTGHIDGIPFVKHSRYRSEFREIGPLGKGGFGTVFRCENMLDGRQYAIKKVRIPSGEELSQRLQRVLREVKTLARLDHPNVVRYYTAWLEAEEHENGKRESHTSIGGSNNEGLCFSAELASSTPSTSDGRNGDRRAPVNSMTSNPVYDMANPLGWNGIDLDQDFGEKDMHVSEGSEFGGFHFDRSSGSFDVKNDAGRDSGSSAGGEINEVALAHSPTNSTATPMASNKRHLSIDLSSDSDGQMSETTASIEMQSPAAAAKETKNVQHTLYIQMHLCSQKTLADFLSNPDARKGNATESSVDVPLAMNIFHQIVKGVQHVHEQGLIHRDLKPSNCFIDEGVVKVGDFGLSRESSASSGSQEEPKEDWLGGDGEDFSAGIGTRAYASPEQQKGSNYDASTDVYSLGIMLFELCYPMCTGMERNIVFSRLRQREFPQDWQDNVATSFPVVDSLVAGMLSPRSHDRPSASSVATRVESLLGEFTVLYLDRDGHEDGCTLLRVEAATHEGILPQTIQLINEAAPNTKILQYGLRGQDSNSIMEFALSNATTESVERIMSELRSKTEIHRVRQVSDSVSIKL